MSAGVHISWGGRLLPFGEQVLGGRGLTLQPGQPRLLIHTRHRLTRRRITAMTWRLAAAFCSSAQLGSNARLPRI